ACQTLGHPRGVATVAVSGAEETSKEVNPYYEDSAATLYHADCLDILPSLGPVDHVITDPPYSEHVHQSNRRGLTAHAGVFAERRDLGFDAINAETRRMCGAWFGWPHVRRWVVVFSDTESAHLWREAIASKYIRTAFWHKVGGAPQFTGD